MIMLVRTGAPLNNEDQCERRGLGVAQEVPSLHSMGEGTFRYFYLCFQNSCDIWNVLYDEASNNVINSTHSLALLPWASSHSSGLLDSC